MINLRKFSIAVPVLAALTAPALANPEKLWQVTGLEMPESALPDVASDTVYVANVNGDPMKKDGVGSIAKVSLDGKKVEKDWVKGLNAPKGMAISNGHLFTADIDELVEIDLTSGSIVAKHKAEGAVLLNDVAADSKGVVYVSDTGGGGVFRLSGGKLEKWLTDPIFAGANGLVVEGDNLIVNTWGVLTGKGFETSSPGRMLSVALADGKVTELDGGKPVGNLDGMAALGGGTYLISDWMSGKVMKFTTGGKVETIIEDGQGTADLDYDATSKIIYLPQMMKGTLTAYKLQ